MTVSELMTTDVATCTPANSLGQVVQLMIEHDCGLIPVVEEGHVTGVLTDRDVSIALATHGRTPAHLTAGEAMSHPVFFCRPDDTIATALGTMGQHRVRRLPVVDAQGVLRGIVTMNDIVLAPSRPKGPTADDIIETLRAICRHPKLELELV